MPTGTQYLYIQLASITELAGCELLLEWCPGSVESSGCYEFLVGAHPSGTGNNCVWLMRGNQIEGVNDVDRIRWLIAFASDECNTACDSGNVARMLLDFSLCGGDRPGGYCTHYCKVTDCEAKIDLLSGFGWATILGGPGCHPCGLDGCASPVDGTTWGRLKAMYK
jgi:hypothetical protein